MLAVARRRPVTGVPAGEFVTGDAARVRRPAAAVSVPSVAGARSAPGARDAPRAAFPPGTSRAMSVVGSGRTVRRAHLGAAVRTTASAVSGSGRGVVPRARVAVTRDVRRRRGTRTTVAIVAATALGTSGSGRGVVPRARVAVTRDVRRRRGTRTTVAIVAATALGTSGQAIPGVGTGRTASVPSVVRSRGTGAATTVDVRMTVGPRGIAVTTVLASVVTRPGDRRRVSATAHGRAGRPARDVPADPRVRPGLPRGPSDGRAPSSRRSLRTRRWGSSAARCVAASVV
ncbi:hypothetical protein SAMN04324258_4346 [Krasilnikoviella flava]|uniref:Uncharacterized protein n=1 Tax=Krasilnikoviella flava TaxID=526729 RepID=A0A1T5M2D4_9MICO|nr:hypothetical protein SAMN04324258_4346 [Krasilnikoviella flava]